jgi:hypothetical protein
MKKTLLFLALVLTAMTFLNAQEISDKTIGLRFGDDDGLGAEITFQKHIMDINRLEFGLAWRSNSNYNAYKLTGTYQWIWEIDGNFNWYAGFGGGLGNWKLKSGATGSDGFFLFAAGDIGVEYKFDFPLLVSLDFRPEIGFANFNSDLGLDIALGLRYTFD